MTWEFRFVNMPSDNGGEDWLELREVYYNEDGSLMGHADPHLGSETAAGVKQIAAWWLRASQLPPLHEKDFPNCNRIMDALCGKHKWVIT